MAVRGLGAGVVLWGRVVAGVLVSCCCAVGWLAAGCGGGEGGGGDGGGGGGGPGSTHWAVLVYMAADNDLGPWAVKNINQMEEIGSSDLVDIVVQVDLRAGVAGAGTGGGCRRYRIERDGDTTTIGSPVLEDLGEVNMADSTTLRAFLQWARVSFPAQRYLVVLWGHGSGWRNESVGIASIFDDWSSGAPQFLLPNYRVREAMEAAGLRADILAFDACAMASLEAAYEFRGLADVMVASQEAVWQDGYPYVDILRYLSRHTDTGPEDVAAEIVSLFGAYYTVTEPRWEQCLSAVRLGLVAAVAQEADALAQVLVSEARAGIGEARALAEDFTVVSPQFADLGDLAGLLEGKVGVDTSALREALASALVANYHRGSGDRGHPRAGGLSVYFPLTKTLYEEDPSYDNYNPSTGAGSPSEFMELHWDEFLKAYFGTVNP